MDFSRLEELLFAGDGACICESEEICVKRLNEAYDLLDKVDSANFTIKDYTRFTNIFIRYIMCSVASFDVIKEYEEVMSQFYQIAIDSPFYSESEV